MPESKQSLQQEICLFAVRADAKGTMGVLRSGGKVR